MCAHECVLLRLRTCVLLCALPSWWQVAIRLPRRSAEVEGCHLLFLFYHASSKDVKTQPFSFAFLPITNESGVMLMDSRYKVRVLPACMAGHGEAPAPGVCRRRARARVLLPS